VTPDVLPGIDAPYDAGPDPYSELCGGRDDLVDLALATEALRILGYSRTGTVPTRCNECHSISRTRIRQ
jgi:hypothetical protein